jgi:hypothetical protein
MRQFGDQNVPLFVAMPAPAQPHPAAAYKAAAVLAMPAGLACAGSHDRDGATPPFTLQLSPLPVIILLALVERARPG